MLCSVFSVFLVYGFPFRLAFDHTEQAYIICGSAVPSYILLLSMRLTPQLDPPRQVNHHREAVRRQTIQPVDRFPGKRTKSQRKCAGRWNSAKSAVHNLYLESHGVFKFHLATEMIQPTKLPIQ